MVRTQRTGIQNAGEYTIFYLHFHSADSFEANLNDYPITLDQSGKAEFKAVLNPSHQQEPEYQQERLAAAGTGFHP